MAIIYGLKVNISVAIVAMVNHTAIGANSNGQNTEHNNDTFKDGPFAWTGTEQGAVLGSYFVGYIPTQIPGGRLAELHSARLVFLASVLLNILASLLTPLASALDHRVLAALRLVAGCGGGCTFPALNVMIAAWSPPQERSSVASICFGGASLGTVISTLTSGIEDELEPCWSQPFCCLGLLMTYCGWESVFYVHGSVACIWCFLWLGLVSDTPQKHRFISEEERKFIIDSQHTSDSEDSVGKRALAVPWRQILTSVPFLTLTLWPISATTLAGTCCWWSCPCSPRPGSGWTWM